MIKRGYVLKFIGMDGYVAEAEGMSPVHALNDAAIFDDFAQANYVAEDLYRGRDWKVTPVPVLHAVFRLAEFDA